MKVSKLFSVFLVFLFFVFVGNTYGIETAALMSIMSNADSAKVDISSLKSLKKEQVDKKEKAQKKDLNMYHDPVDQEQVQQLQRYEESLQLSPIEKMYNGGAFETAFSLDTGKIPAVYKNSPILVRMIELKEKYKNAIRQFGYDIFQNNSGVSFSTFDIPVGPDYIVGPGDQLVIRIWGKIDESLDLTIDNQGRIYIPRVGHIFLGGEKYGKVKDIIEQAIAKYYVNFEISVTIGKLRSIKVFVLGDVLKPGAYDVSALSTAFMALYAAGGPTKMGTLRKIQVKRGNKTVRNMDLYDYLLKGNRKQDIALEAFDTIFVKSIGKTLKISGAINKPGIFEIKDKTSVYNVLNKLAGGFSTHSYKKRIQLERISGGQKKIVMDLDFSSEKKMRNVLQKEFVQEGDCINIYSILGKQFNYLTINGAVNRPGNYEFAESFTLQELIEQADGFLDNAYLERIDVSRYINEDEAELISVDYQQEDGKKFRLKQWDKIKVYTKNYVLGSFQVAVEGAVRRPGSYSLYKDMYLSDLVFLAGILPEASYAKCELYRKLKGEDDEIIPINLKEVVSHPKTSSSDFLLEDRDHLFVRFDPTMRKVFQVKLSGKFMYPGTYYAKAGESLEDIINRAGGYEKNAFVKGAVFKRVAIGKKNVTDRVNILREEKKKIIYNQVAVDDAAVAKKFSESKIAVLGFLQEKLGEDAGRLVVNLYDKKDGNALKIIIEDGDSLYIPEMPTSVQLVGGVQNSISVLYNKGKDVNYYINKAGGFSEFADRGNIYLFKADGSVQKNVTKVEVGDTIYIPENIRFHFNMLDVVAKVTEIGFQIFTVVKILGFF
jgi:polysaccharide biosynthesis/export protein